MFHSIVQLTCWLYFQYISEFGVPAVQGFFKSIALSHGNSLQDTLRLLTLWFDYGSYDKVYDAIHKGIQTIEIGTWLQVTSSCELGGVSEGVLGP